MCGIAGFFAHGVGAQPLTEATLVAIRDAMRARGPDGHGLWFDDSRRVGLAHRRLSIIDLSEAGHQPMLDDIGRYALTFNGEIYNYQVLRDALIADGEVFRSESDTETVLRLYAKHGSAMLPMLRGMFAIAIWDRQERSLFLARDPYGIKPLYYADQGGCLRFASQVKALLADRSISREISPAGRVGFELMGSIPEPFTLYAAIRSCPAGSHITVREGQGMGTPVRYASIAEALAHPQPDTGATPADLLRDSVRHHMVADVEVGAFLSGGVDSGSIVGLMRDCGAASIRACTLSFEEFSGTAADEVPRAARIASHYGVDHHIRTVTADEFAASVPQIFADMDQPSIDGFNSWFVSKACRELGLKVALSGLGGDELLCGYSTFNTIPQTHHRFGVLANIPGLGGMSRALLSRLMPGLVARNPKLAGLLEHAGSWAGTYLLRRAVLLPFEVERTMDPDFARAGLEELNITRIIGQALEPDPGNDAGRVSALESTLYMRNQLLRDSDWAGMAHSLEIRVPLVDFSLLRGMARFQPQFVNGAGKAVLARAPSNPLPDQIVNQPKTGFTIPVARWITGDAALQGSRIAGRRSSGHILDGYLQAITA